ncbi:Alpha carbonic anhydrase [Trinorchestia longiramus]|nr:Alpha carbonic anhydrase [Trinorchestia longiramus]
MYAFELGGNDIAVGEFDWTTWWGYDGISGPSFWGVINRGWRLCSDGRRQSPVNIDLRHLVFDHNIQELVIDDAHVNGVLLNTGFGLRWSPALEVHRNPSTSSVPASSSSSSNSLHSLNSLHSSASFMPHSPFHSLTLKEEVHFKARPRRTIHSEHFSRSHEEERVGSLAHSDYGESIHWLPTGKVKKYQEKERKLSPSEYLKSLSRMTLNASDSYFKSLTDTKELESELGRSDKEDRSRHFRHNRPPHHLRFHSYGGELKDTIRSIKELNNQHENYHRNEFEDHSLKWKPMKNQWNSVNLHDTDLLEYNQAGKSSTRSELERDDTSNNGVNSWDNDEQKKNVRFRSDDIVNKEAPLGAGEGRHPHQWVRQEQITLGGGPLLYRYALSHVVLRWAASQAGSEHSLADQFFPAEVQLYFYNTVLYDNFTVAAERPNGVAAVAVFVKEGKQPNSVLNLWLNHLPSLRSNGASAVESLPSLASLMPTEHFVTYDGSLTEPPCEETVTWIVLNRPLYLTRNQLWELQSLRRGSGGGLAAPSLGNVRPTQSLGGRTLRTNIPHAVGWGNTPPYKCASQPGPRTLYRVSVLPDQT